MSEPTAAAMRAAKSLNATTFAMDECVSESARVIDSETCLPELIDVLRELLVVGGEPLIGNEFAVTSLPSVVRRAKSVLAKMGETR